MLFRLFGNYLVEQKVLNESQLDELMEYRTKNRVKLGVLAVEQKLMTPAQSDEVNRLQALADKRFGEIAIEKGYLTEEDMENMLQKQGNPYVLFLQAVTEKGYMTRDDLCMQLEEYRKANDMNDSELEIIKNGVFDEVLDVMLHAENRFAEELLKLAVKNIIRFISSDIFIDRITQSDSFFAEHLAYQAITGAFPIVLGFASGSDELLTVASSYAKEEFAELDADAYDSVCEFINCINGLFARTHSMPDRELELHPPIFKEASSLHGELYLLPIRINNKAITLIVKFG